MTTQEILQGVHDWTNGKIVYDISVAHPDGQGNPTKYATLAAALGTNGANIPQNLRKGGMSVKFVQSSDNKYVQYFLTKDEWSLSEADWQKMNLEDEVSQLGQKLSLSYDRLNVLEIDYLLTLDWSIGTLDSSATFSDETTAQRRRISTPDSIVLATSFYVSVDSGYLLKEYSYSDGSWTSKDRTGSNKSITAGTKKFSIYKIGSTEEQSSIYELLRHVHSSIITGEVPTLRNDLDKTTSDGVITTENTESLRSSYEQLYKDLIYNFDWEIGVISSDTGDVVPSNKKGIYTDIITLSESIEFSVEDNYILYVYKFVNGTYDSYSTVTNTPKTYAAGTYKFCVANHLSPTAQNSIYPLLLQVHSDKASGKIPEIEARIDGIDDLFIEEGSVWN